MDNCGIEVLGCALMSTAHEIFFNYMVEIKVLFKISNLENLNTKVKSYFVLIKTQLQYLPFC